MLKAQRDLYKPVHGNLIRQKCHWTLLLINTLYGKLHTWIYPGWQTTEEKSRPLVIMMTAKQRPMMLKTNEPFICFQRQTQHLSTSMQTQ